MRGVSCLEAGLCAGTMWWVWTCCTSFTLRGSEQCWEQKGAWTLDIFSVRSDWSAAGQSESSARVCSRSAAVSVSSLCLRTDTPSCLWKASCAAAACLFPPLRISCELCWRTEARLHLSFNSEEGRWISNCFTWSPVADVSTRCRVHVVKRLHVSSHFRWMKPADTRSFRSVEPSTEREAAGTNSLRAPVTDAVKWRWKTIRTVWINVSFTAVSFTKLCYRIKLSILVSVCIMLKITIRMEAK